MIMDTTAKKTAQQLQKELIALLLQKASVKEKDIYRVSKNLDLLTREERKKYQSVIL